VNSPQNIGVVITTYNAPAWLEKVLFGYEAQSTKHFRVIIADDGSGPETHAIIERFKARGTLTIDHVWHPDNGFQKCVILNRAIAQTDCDYLIFTDGDCIPEPRFVEVHQLMARPGNFLSGGYIKLTLPVSQIISEADILHSRIFERRWLLEHGQPPNNKLWKLVKNPYLKAFLNRVTPAGATWNGMNSSTWTQALRAINGFNEDMQYGGLDRELGERLLNYGLRPKQIRYSVSCLHLDHPRSYDNPETWKKNYAIRREVKRTGRSWTPNGIVKRTPPAHEVY
jgi:glycosyltransferase involved in cell wall biosynthesis